MPRILIVDDDDQVRSMLKATLETVECTVEVVSNAKEGLRLCRENPIDLVITDIIMPDKDGLETTQQIRRDFPGIKIIAISGGGRGSPEDYLKMARMFGADLAFSKPIEQSVLLNAVSELTGKMLQDKSGNK